MYVETLKTHTQFLFQQGGARKLLRHANENIFFDLKYKIETSQWLETPAFLEKPENLEHGVRYRASATSEVFRSLNIVKKLVNTSEYGFYDLGCGKGKVLCISGQKYNFSEQVGLDYYRPFIETAQRNLTRCHIKDTQLHYMDMTKFHDFKKKSVIYMYNPADDYILSQVKENLEQLTEHTILIYNKPIHANLFQNWDVINEKVESDPDHCTTIFEYRKK